jgi:sugar/nucleoside kinase (ribokinase family)
MAAATACAFFGRSTLDLIYQVSRFPEEDSKTMATAFVAQAGGPALNAAITFAFLGGEAHLMSAVGRGPWSLIVKQEVERHGVCLSDLCDVENFSPPISSVVIHAPAGSRTIFNSPDLLPDEITPVSVPIEPLLLADGFYASRAGSLFREFAARGGVICLDGGSWRPEIDTLLPLAQIAICSESFRPPGTRSNKEVLEYLVRRGVAAAAMTRGGLDIIAWERGRSLSIPIESVRAIDTLGAGDILHGAFCWYYLYGRDFEQALRRAAKVATRSVQFFGAREWMAHFSTRDE